MKFVHAADLHLDSPIRGWGRSEGAPREEIQLATRKACERLIDLCLAEDADALLIAGDVFDGDWKDYHTGLFFHRQLCRLDCPVVLIHGNHDAATVLTRSLKLPPHVTVLDHRQPQTVELEAIGLAVHGQSFRDRVVRENLARGYPAPLPGLCNVGLLHGNVTGSSEHERYAPCTIAELVAHGYHYWALGHIHKREVLHRSPWVVYPGNPQGRTIREAGPKGAMVVGYQREGIESVDFQPLDVVRWLDVEIDASPFGELSELYDAFEETLEEAHEEAAGRPLLARVTLTGESPLHSELVRRRTDVEHELEGVALSVGSIFPERLRVKTSRPGRKLPKQELLSLECALQEEFQRIREDDEVLAWYLEELRKLGGKVGRHLPERPDSEEYVRPLIGDIEEWLLERCSALGNEGRECRR